MTVPTPPPAVVAENIVSSVPAFHKQSLICNTNDLLQNGCFGAKFIISEMYNKDISSCSSLSPIIQSPNSLIATGKIQDMGCLVSKPNDAGGNRKRPTNVGDMVVFVPGLRAPKSSDFTPLLSGRLSSNMIKRISTLQTQVVLLADKEIQITSKSKKRTASHHEGSTFADLQQSLEDYLPVLLGLVKDGNQLEHLVEFVWVNQEDAAEANLLLLPKTTADGYQPKTTEDSKRISVDVFLKAAGYLHCAIQNVIPRMPPDARKNLPDDLKEEVLHALCMQALGQGAYVQLGMAIDSSKATLAVKRRLACEMVKYWHEAHEIISNVSLSCYWGDKHRLFIKWKYVEAKAAAYYFHGMILGETNTEKSHALCVASLQAADEFLNESKMVLEQFCTAPPQSRCPPPWGATKYLCERIPKDASGKTLSNNKLHGNHENTAEAVPPLPDFPVALKPDEFNLPPPDTSWDVNGSFDEGRAGLTKREARW